MKNYQRLTSKNQDVKQYFSRIQRAIPDTCPDKEKSMYQIHQDVEHYLAEFPDASYADVQQEFGTPTEAASAFIDTLSSEEIAEALSLKKKYFVLQFQYLL